MVNRTFTPTKGNNLTPYFDNVVDSNTYNTNYVPLQNGSLTSIYDFNYHDFPYLNTEISAPSSSEYRTTLFPPTIVNEPPFSLDDLKPIGPDYYEINDETPISFEQFRPQTLRTDFTYSDPFQSNNPAMVASDIEELNQGLLNLKKENPNYATTDETKDLKTCNCKMSSCLKLYCDCFAGSMYCSDSCQCQNCFNKSCYEEEVEIARNKILAKKPLAFDPKVIYNESSTTTMDKTKSGRGTSRHINGCKCKNSACRKKYCECYRNNVGCSSECQCKGCNNSYGAKSTDGLSLEALVYQVDCYKIKHGLV